MNNETSATARFTSDHGGVVITGLTITDVGVVAEAEHWVDGRRGDRCDDAATLAGADLSVFATEALVLGARALTLTAQSNEARVVERMLREVGDKTERAMKVCLNQHPVEVPVGCDHLSACWMNVCDGVKKNAVRTDDEGNITAIDLEGTLDSEGGAAK